MWVDTHCHVYDPGEGRTVENTIAAAREEHVVKMVCVGTARDTSIRANEIALANADIFSTVGVHPHDATDGTESIRDLITRDKVVGIGECGLDYHYSHSPHDVQQRVFAEHIQLAHETDHTLVIHSRDAWEDTFRILDTEGMPSRVVFHCFTGGPAEALECTKRGGYLSFSGIITFKNAEDTRAALLEAPRDRVLIETDSPYLAPVPFRGKPNHPALVSLVGAKVAEVLGISEEEASKITTENALRAFPGIRV
jgi:TatD DNase family protein